MEIAIAIGLVSLLVTVITSTVGVCWCLWLIQKNNAEKRAVLHGALDQVRKDYVSDKLCRERRDACKER